MNKYMNTTKYVIFALSMILMLSIAQPVMAASNNADFQLSDFVSSDIIGHSLSALDQKP